MLIACQLEGDNSLQLQGNFEESIKVAKKAISINPNHDIAFNNITASFTRVVELQYRLTNKDHFIY